jgi:hypothetical protein
MDVGMSVWLPGGDLAEYRSVKEQREMVDTVLDVGSVRYEMLEAGKTWRLTMEADAPARPCANGANGANAGAAGANGTNPAAGLGVGQERQVPSTRPVHLALDVRFDAVTPAIGVDGQRQGVTNNAGGPKSAQSVAAAGTVGKGHLEQAGRWTGWLEVDGVRHRWERAHGNRDSSWGPRRWGGPKMWRWFSINVGDDMHFGGIRLGTDAGDLHRGWVWDGDRAASVAEWRVRTELADDGVTHKVVHLQVLDKKGRTYDLRGDVLRVADMRQRQGTMVNEGLARWTYHDPAGISPDRTGYGICEYLHQLDDSGRPVVPVE